MKPLRITFIILTLILPISNLYSQTDSIAKNDTLNLMLKVLITTANNQKTDSLKLWNFDIIKKEKSTDDTNLISTIIFFRNKPIIDSIYEKKHGIKYFPNMSFNIYPIKLYKAILKEEGHVRSISSCSFVGTNLFVTKNFVFYLKSYCNICYASNYESDYCRNNINQIIKYINQKSYKTLDELLLDLPIEQRKFK